MATNHIILGLKFSNQVREVWPIEGAKKRVSHSGLTGSFENKLFATYVIIHRKLLSLLEWWGQVYLMVDNPLLYYNRDSEYFFPIPAFQVLIVNYTFGSDRKAPTLAGIGPRSDCGTARDHLWLGSRDPLSLVLFLPH